MRRIVIMLLELPANVESRVREMRAAGMVVCRVNTLMGVVSGTATAEVVAALRAMPNVSYVADETCLWDRAAFT